MRTKSMEDFGKRWKEESWVDRVFGPVCPRCGKRPYTFAASKNAEGGRDSVCKCDEKD